MRTLTTPVTNEVADKQYVSEGRYVLFLNADDSINMEKSFYQYTVTSLPGKQVAVKRIAAKDLPAAFRAEVRDVHQMVVTHAESEGLLFPGTDVDDL